MHDNVNEDILEHILLNSYKNSINLTEHDKINLLKFYKQHPFRTDDLKTINNLIKEKMDYYNSMKKHDNAKKELCKIIQKELS